MAPPGAFFMKVYFLNGLGVDSRVFREIDLPEHELVFLEWIPLSNGETMRSYAQKFLAYYEIEQDSVLVGLSFGGMLAHEIATLQCHKGIVLISSSLGKQDFPWYLKLFLSTRLFFLLPDKTILRSNAFSRWLFGVHAQEDIVLLNDLFGSMDPQQVRRMIQCIQTWRPESVATQTYRIHGTQDHLLKIPENVEYPIAEAGHFAVFTHATVVSASLKSCLNEINKLPKNV